MSASLMKDTSIKVLMRTVIIIVTLAVCGFIATTWMKSNSLMEKTMEQERISEAMRAMAESRYHVIQIQQFLTDVGATADLGGYDEAQKELSGAMASLDRLEATMPDLTQRVEGFRSDVRSLHEVGVRMAKAYVAEGRDAGNAIMQDSSGGFDARSKKIANGMEELIDSLDGSLSDATRNLNNEEQSDRFAIVGLSMALMIFLAVSGGILYYKVIPPLKTLLLSLRDMNNGSNRVLRGGITL